MQVRAPNLKTGRWNAVDVKGDKRLPYIHITYKNGVPSARYVKKPRSVNATHQP